MPTENPPPNWHVRCVSVPGPDTDLTLHVSFDNARFMFGCGEGTQRAYVQKKLGLRGLQAIFLPSAQSRTRSGLPGLLMTAADMGMPKIDVIGPPDTAHFIATHRQSHQRERFVIEPHSFPWGRSPDHVETVFSSANITVKAIALAPSHDQMGRPLAFQPTAERDASKAGESETSGEPDVLAEGFRASLLSRPQLEKWREMIVRDMFGRLRRPKTWGTFTEPHTPFVFRNGEFRPAKTEFNCPLPLPTTAEASIDMVYICQAPDVRGKFDVVLANALKVPNGPLRGKLTRGESIEVADPAAPNGKRVVRPEDCLVGGGPGAILIVLTCTRYTMDALLASAAIQRYQTDPNQVHLIVHRVPRVVWSSDRYKAWMTAFGPQTQHLIADPDEFRNDVFFTSSAWNTLCLRAIVDDWFAMPSSERIPPSEPIELPSVGLLAEPNHLVKMYPPAQIERVPRHEKDRAFPMEPEELVRVRAEIQQVVADVIGPLERSAEAVQLPPWARPLAGEDILVTTLGTGSALPSKYRNVSATHLDIPSFGGVLLDCGEGTLGQLRRRFGLQGMQAFFRNLRLIFISHMHADHHGGLQAILEERFKLGFESRLYLIGPAHIGFALQESASWQMHVHDKGPLNRVVFLLSKRLRDDPYIGRDDVEMDGPHVKIRQFPSSAIRNDEINREDDIAIGARRWPDGPVYGPGSEQLSYHVAQTDQMMIDLDLTLFHTPAVEHRGIAFGLVMAHKSGWKIVYSGDTMPCDALVEAGQDATLLIHEATFDDDEAEMAVMKGHSTSGQAIEVGKRMNAKHILLNHFSQRYPKIPAIPQSMESSGSADQPVVAIAFDLMSIKIGDMWRMAQYMDAFAALYRDATDPEDDEARAAGAENDANELIDHIDDEPHAAPTRSDGIAQPATASKPRAGTMPARPKGKGRKGKAALVPTQPNGTGPVKSHESRAGLKARRGEARRADEVGREDGGESGGAPAARPNMPDALGAEGDAAKRERSLSPSQSGVRARSPKRTKTFIANGPQFTARGVGGFEASAERRDDQTLEIGGGRGG